MEGTTVKRVGAVDEFVRAFLSDASRTVDASVKVENLEDDNVGLMFEESKTHGDGAKSFVYSYRGDLLARFVILYAKDFANVYDDSLVDEMWVELDKIDPALNWLTHGSSRVGLIYPDERCYESTLLVGSAKAAWFELQKTRVGIRFDFESKTVTVEEFKQGLPGRCSGMSFEWRYFEDAKGNLYENNCAHDAYARIWQNGVLTAMEWSGCDEKANFIDSLKPVEDADRVLRSVSFHMDSDDIDETELRFFAEGSDGKVREYQGILKFQSVQTGNYILMFVDDPRRSRDSLKLYASSYHPLQWRALKKPGSGMLELGRLVDSRDWEEVFNIIGYEGDVATLGASATDSACVALPKGSLGLLDKAHPVVGF